MKDNSVRKILFRLGSLSILLAGVMFFATDRQAYTVYADDYTACDNAFPGCNNNCNSTNAIPCYGNCQTTYFGCLYTAGHPYSHTPMINYNQQCWENAENVFNHCLIGEMPGTGGGVPDYPAIYAAAMLANENGVMGSCYEVQQAWWGFNGPNCY